MADAVNENIVAQGNKIRQLKADKAPKDAVGEEVKTLLSLKAEYKSLTGQDWKPAAAAPQPSAPKETPYAGGGFTDEQKKALETAAAEALDIKIADVGEHIRKMKAGKADKAAVGEEVKVWIIYLRRPKRSAAHCVMQVHRNDCIRIMYSLSSNY